MGLKATQIGKLARRDRLLLVAALAQVLLKLLEAATEAAKLDRYHQANTVQRRTHSLFHPDLYWYHAIPNLRRQGFDPAADRVRPDRPGARGILAKLRDNWRGYISALQAWLAYSLRVTLPHIDPLSLHVQLDVLDFTRFLEPQKVPVELGVSHPARLERLPAGHQVPDAAFAREPCQLQTHDAGAMTGAIPIRILEGSDSEVAARQRSDSVRQIRTGYALEVVDTSIHPCNII